MNRPDSLEKNAIRVPVALRVLFAEFPFTFSPAQIPDVSVTGIAIDSRKVEPGNLFVAMEGSSADGHTFIADAIAHVARAVICEREMTGLPVPWINVQNSRQSLTWLAAAFYGNPGRKLTVIGVTGTDGKTTTCNLIYRILLSAGFRTGLISTVNAIIGEEVLDTGFHVTTPDAPDVQHFLARMVEDGLSHAVLETTSHGWAQYRVDACEFDIGVITNITHEHLDQHGSYENYRAAKARLFQSLEKTRPKPQGNPRLAVLNKDDRSYEYLSAQVSGPQINYGMNPTADIRAESVIYSPRGIHFEVVGDGFRFPVTSPLVGAFNVSNCLAALTAAIGGLGVNHAAVVDGIASMPGIPGRMERIDLGQPFTAIVDFAHTPNALRVALETIRKMTDGRVIVVFGSAGLRDKEKRRMMAEVSAQWADISILTAEDPRTESLEGILNEMAGGARLRGGVEGKTFWRVPDRGEAIRLGVHLAQPGDVVVACGKGHEQSMCFGTIEYPWDDRVALRSALSDSLHIAGPEMPFLPTQVK
ncbi:MAG: UDP-N-acetylmuramoyl-L-alanyl-D-glutamate--2,6-diaminopimelate ligase [Anaerolineales bacterium]